MRLVKDNYLTFGATDGWRDNELDLIRSIEMEDTMQQIAEYQLKTDKNVNIITGWVKDHDIFNERGLNMAVQNMLTQQYHDVIQYFHLSNTQTDKFLVYSANGNELTDLDGVFIPLNEDDDGLPILVIVEFKQHLTSDLFEKKLKQWQELGDIMSQIGNGTFPKKKKGPLADMTKFFLENRRFESKLEFYVGSRLWRDDQFPNMNELLQDSGLNVQLLRGNERDQYETFHFVEK